MARADLPESVLNQFIDEEALGVCFELHRAIKLGYYELLYPEDSSLERHVVVDQPGSDVFGNTVQMLKKQVDCACPSCSRTLGASKFAPHLEKCLGMGRSSSRLAHKRAQVAVESEGENSEDEEEWTFPEKKAKRMRTKDKLSNTIAVKTSKTSPFPRGQDGYQSNGSHASSTDSVFPKSSLHQHTIASVSALPNESKSQLLQTICGVVSERTGRLCTRSINCPQHSNELRQHLRKKVLGSSYNHPEVVGLPSSHRNSASSTHLAENLETDLFEPPPSFADPASRPTKRSREGRKHRRHHRSNITH